MIAIFFFFLDVFIQFPIFWWYRFGHLVDLYAWNPHCRYLDGTGPPGSGMYKGNTINKNYLLV